MVDRERRAYQKKCEQVFLYLDKFCSFIVNGPEQEAFGLQHFTFNTKKTTGHSIKVKLIVVLEHGSIKKLFHMTMTAEIQTGANHIIEAFYRFSMIESVNRSLPNFSYLQFGNCSREQKQVHFILS